MGLSTICLSLAIRTMCGCMNPTATSAITRDDRMSNVLCMAKKSMGGGFSAPWLIVFTPVLPESHTARLKRYRPLRRRPIGFSAEHTTAERKRGRRPAHRAPFRHPKPHKNSHNIRDRKISRSKFAHSKYDAVGRRSRGRYRTVARQSQDGHGAAARWSREGHGTVTGPLWDGYGAPMQPDMRPRRARTKKER